MKNVHRNIRLVIASVFAVEGALVQTCLSHALSGEVWGVMGTIISTAVLFSSILAVAYLELKADRIDSYGVTEDGYISIEDIFNDPEDSAESRTESFDEMTADFHDPDQGRVYIGEIDQPVFDVDLTEPKYVEAASDELVLAGLQEFVVSSEGDVTPHTVEIAKVPVKPSHEPSAPTAPREYSLQMLDFHVKPLEDPDFLLALEKVHREMGSDDKLLLVGKSYGLGARGFRREGGVTVYSKSDVKKIINKFLTNPQRGIKAIASGTEEGAEK